MQRQMIMQWAFLCFAMMALTGCPKKEVVKPTKRVVKIQRTAPGVYQEALMMHKQQQGAAKPEYGSVIKLYQEALSLDPSLQEAHFNLGSIYETVGSYKKAANHFGQILQSNPKHAAATYRLAQVYVRMRQPQRALSLLNTFMRLSPKAAKSPKMLLNVATVQVLSGNYTGALRNARKCLAINAKDIAAYRLIARVYYRQKRYEGVHVVYELSQKLKKPDARLLNIRGRAFMAQKKYPEAIESFAQAVQLDPKLFAAQMNLGSLALQYYDKQRAVNALGQAVRLRPRNKKALLGYAVALRANKKFKLAESVYKQRLLTFFPNDADSLFNLSVLYLKFMNKPKVAKSYLRKYIGVKGATISTNHVSYTLLKQADQKIKAQEMMKKMQQQQAAAAKKDAAKKKAQPKKQPAPRTPAAKKQGGA